MGNRALLLSFRCGAATKPATTPEAKALFEAIKAEVRELKIAIDGKFSYKKPESREARKLFHLPLNRAYAPKMGE